MPTEKKFVIRCRAIILHEGKLLLVRHAHDTTFACLPGGHLEWREGIRECLKREIVEELGVEPEIGRLLYINTFLEEGDTQPVEFFFEVLNGVAYENVETLIGSHASEIAEIIWANPADSLVVLPRQLGEDFKSGTLLSDEVRYMKD